MARFVYVIFIESSPEDLWKALTDPKFTQQYWWGRRLETDWKIGSEIRAVYDGGNVDWEGKVLDFQPFKKLSYTFHLEQKPELKKDEPSVVTFEISEVGKSVVKLTVIHDNLSEKGFEDVSSGWPAILSSIKTVVESGRSMENTRA